MPTLSQLHPPVLTLDVGGTKLAAGIMLADNRIVCRKGTRTLAHEGAVAILDRLLELSRKVLESFAHEYKHIGPPQAIGLASAGYIDRATGTVLFATENLPGWTGQPLAVQLKTALGLPAFVENDAACFGLAEAILGAGQGYRHVLVVAVGTGVGGGIIVNGDLYTGWQGRAGAIGHLVVEPVAGRPCTCGLSGCLESYAATRIMVANSGFPTIQVLADHYRRGGTAPAVDEAARWLGIGLASLAHVIGPQAIVIGGSIGLLGERYLTQVRLSFKEHATLLHRSIPILPAQLEADSGLLGAGVLARRGLQRSEK